MTNARTALEARYIPMLEYAAAWDLQKSIVQQIDKEERPETLLLLQHPPTYTIGSDRHPEHLLLDEEQLKEQGISLFEIDRGGDITYHGPGQLVGYPILFLDSATLDLHGYLRSVEQVIINWLSGYGITAGRKPEYTGVWVGDEKIAAIGVKFNRSRGRKGFITSHGFALNIVSGIGQGGFSGIVPCGIEQYGVTSFNDLTGLSMTVEQAAREIVPHFSSIFGYERHSLVE
ncbi:lipoyl(octanoyl) transferase LipB [Paenibacillus sp. NEAU-GSW1]|uniref:lipoyl(octanoyl) transferase LipB n=1 Tax=Paenibacillus sp. NEAU-GSW1 TaxID=2682486 RepID=UPI0012E1684D|nr:lipoyl(octanoyl) transferase LipB [Paenibacillus sp. NEAU-GSW1]MUT65560.1 lipoyl(octanoyl) transferase LipB [Paenibacillus sp. NEAU-GSW1]